MGWVNTSRRKMTIADCPGNFWRARSSLEHLRMDGRVGVAWGSGEVIEGNVSSKFNAAVGWPGLAVLLPRLQVKVLSGQHLNA